jgi:enoyl-CoA hydratase/carnithine racemase
MSTSLVDLERRADGVAVITLNNPKVNALSPELLTQLAGVVEGLADDLPGAVVVTGGERVFAAGADISRFGGPDEARSFGACFTRAFNGLAALPRLTIAAVAGYALGGGCELALACDFRVVSTKAVFGQPEILLGIIPGAGGTQRLPRLIGAARAKELVMSGRQVKADEALRIGLADEVVEHEQLHTRVLELAASYAAGPLQAQAAAKRAIDEGLEGPLLSGLRLEQELFAATFATEDGQIGVKSFLEHGPGKATFTGR